MTATPRYFTGNGCGRLGTSTFEVASMDDEEIFGPVLHRLTFGEAIARGCCSSDYRVVVVGTDDRHLPGTRCRGRL